MPIDGFNKVDVETTTAGTESNVVTESFDGQTNQVSGSSRWVPSGTASSWAVGTNCVSTQNNLNQHWLPTGSDTRLPEFPATTVVGDWHCDFEESPSNHTGPFGGHTGNGSYSTDAAYDYIYTEMSNSAQRTSPLVVRTAGYSLGDSSAAGLDLEFYVWASGSAVGTLAVYESNASTTHGNANNIRLLAKFKAYTFNENSSSATNVNAKTRLKGVLNLSNGLQSFSSPFFNEIWPYTDTFNPPLNATDSEATWKKVTIPLDGYYNDAATDYPNYLDDTTETRYFYFVYHTYETQAELTSAGGDSNLNSAGDTTTTSGFANYAGDIAIDDFRIYKSTAGSQTVHIDSINKVDADGTPAVSWNGVTLLS
jgi:hypothetical protein